METHEISFSRVELSSFLPAGWKADDAGRWNPQSSAWRVAVRDVADQVWELEVTAESAARLGPREALRRAVDRLYREALA